MNLREIPIGDVCETPMSTELATGCVKVPDSDKDVLIARNGVLQGDKRATTESLYSF